MWWILDGGSVGGFSFSVLFSFLRSVDIDLCAKSLTQSDTGSATLSVFLNELDQLLMWCWYIYIYNIAEMARGTWLKKSWEWKVHVPFCLYSYGMDARMPVSGVSFLMAKVHVIDVTEYLSQEAGVVDYLSHWLEFTKKQTAQLLLDAMKNMWCAATSFWCSFLMFNWC